MKNSIILAITSIMVTIMITACASPSPTATLPAATLTTVPPTVTFTVAPPTPTATAIPSTPVPLGERATLDRPDDFPGMYQVHLLYVLPSDAKDQKRDLNGKIDKSIKAANDWFYKESGGSKIRFDTYEGQLDITFVQLDVTSAEIYQASVTKYGGAYWIRDILEEQLSNMNIFQPGKIYLALAEIAKHPSTCDDAAHPPDLMGRMAGFYPSAVVEAGWNCADQNSSGNFGAGSTYADLALIHESAHLLGFASSCGKNPASSDNKSHTGDFKYDLMWAPGPNSKSTDYWDTNHMKLDPGNDDYFKHTIPNCPDLANSAFLDPLPPNPETPPDWPANWKLP
jgi:hypothetical protein